VVQEGERNEHWALGGQPGELPGTIPLFYPSSHPHPRQVPAVDHRYRDHSPDQDHICMYIRCVVHAETQGLQGEQDLNSKVEWRM
jgi:hypothetical protein